MKQILLLLFLTFHTILFAQIQYEKGYYLTNNGEKVEGYIENKDWKYTPESFSFKSSFNSKEKIISIKNSKLFAFENSKVFEKFTVKIDTSKTQLKNLNTDRNPHYNEKTVFLELLVEGDANLYSNNSTNFKKKYFFKTSTNTITQLVFKEYIIKKSNNGTPSVAKNNYFKQQILNNLKCEIIDLNRVNSLSYKKKNLVRIFEDYNKCKDENYNPYYEDKKNSHNIALSIRPGLTYSSIDFTYIDDLNAKFDTEIGYRIGFELEYILPFNNNKWGIIIEPSYSQYDSRIFLKDSNDYTYIDNSQNIEITYNSLGLQAGLRYYFFINNKASIFINGTFYQQFSASNSNLEIQHSRNFSIYKSTNNLAAGVGFNFNRKIALEINYSNRELLNYSEISAKYNQFSLILSYNFL